MTAENSSLLPFEDPRGPAPGLYLHIPFCCRKCSYCSFYSLVAASAEKKRYHQDLLRHIAWCGRAELTRYLRPDTIFFGGGTPTMLAPAALAELLAACLTTFAIAAEAGEISLEANPASVGEQDLLLLRRAGFNRLSLGVQSQNDVELRALGRPHTAAEAITTIHAARRAGFTNLSLDLMYGLPGQSVENWRDTLCRLLDLAPEHLSLYELTPEAGTPLHDALQHGDISLPPEEQILEMMALTRELTSSAGLQRYEISNYARPGYHCAHNLNYWQNGPYLGLGAGAVSCLAGRRFAGIDDLARFHSLVEQDKAPWSEMEILDQETRFRETVIMGLRLLDGVSLSALERRFAINMQSYYGTILTSLLDQELLEIVADHLRLTEQALPLANRVMAQLV